VGRGESSHGLAVANVDEGGGGDRRSGRQGGIMEALGEGVLVLDINDPFPISSLGERGGLTFLLLFVPVSVMVRSPCQRSAAVEKRGIQEVQQNFKVTAYNK
jgi:hypothetical protein